MDQMLGYEPTKITKKLCTQKTPEKKTSLNPFTNQNEFHLETVIGSTIRREAIHSPLPYIMSPPVDVPLSDFSKYMIKHDWKCKCISCNLPQVKVYAFVLGCFYARILYLNANYGMAYKFYLNAMDYWRTLKDTVMVSNEQTLLKTFVYFSSYTHLHMCHCLVQVKKQEEIEHLCNSIKDLLELNVCDNSATIEDCMFTLNVLMENVDEKCENKFPSFELFSLDDDIRNELSPPQPTPAKKFFVKHQKSAKSIPIFMDGQKMSPAQKKRLLFSKKKDTLDSPNVNNLCIDLTSFTTTSEKVKSTKKATVAPLKKSVTDIPQSTSTFTTTKSVRQSTRKTNKENEIKPTPTPVNKRPVLKKKQLKFSPTLDSPAEDVIVLDDTIDEKTQENVKETPKSSTGRKIAPVKAKTVTKPTRSTKKVPVEIELDSDTSVINASIPPPMTLQKLYERRVKRVAQRNK